MQHLVLLLDLAFKQTGQWEKNSATSHLLTLPVAIILIFATSANGL
jgi:hypothetical protein